MKFIIPEIQAEAMENGRLGWGQGCTDMTV